MATLAPAPDRPSRFAVPESLSLFDAVAGDAAQTSRAGEAGGERTLEDVVLGAWEALAVGRSAACPLCADALVPRPGSGARPVGARCAGCATELA